MAKRVGRPSKPFIRVVYDDTDLTLMLTALKGNKTLSIEVKSKLKDKIKFDIAERKRLMKNYENAKARLCKKHGE